MQLYKRLSETAIRNNCPKQPCRPRPALPTHGTERKIFMETTERYTPSLTLLSKMGVSLTAFHPEKDAAEFLLHRTSLELGRVTSPLSYYTAEQPGLGLLHLRSGSLLYTVYPSNASCTLTGDCFLLFDCLYAHRIQVRSTAEYEIVRFSGRDLCSLHSLAYYRHFPDNETPFIQVSASARQASTPHLLFGQEEMDPILCHMLLTTLLCQTLLEKTQPAKTVPAYLQAIKSEFESQYYRKYTLEELELKYKKNKYRICREFKDHFHSSPLQYLHRMRIQAAKDLLVETDLKVHEIGYEVGYENANHFITHFKKITGTTPSQYRARI